jgi:hypothetical protein
MDDDESAVGNNAGEEPVPSDVLSVDERGLE